MPRPKNPQGSYSVAGGEQRDASGLAASLIWTLKGSDSPAVPRRDYDAFTVEGKLPNATGGGASLAVRLLDSSPSG